MNQPRTDYLAEILPPLDVLPALSALPITGREPGLYFGISNDDYHADPALSSSGIKILLRSPEEYHYHYIAKTDPDPDTVATKFGTAYHTFVLEPEAFSYQILPNQKGTTKEGCLADTELAQIIAMKKRLFSNPRHAVLFQGGYPEVSVFWQDEETGVMCRVRFDYWKPGFITDLKTINDIYNGPRYDTPERGYHISGAMYMEGCRQLRRLLREKPDCIHGFTGDQDALFDFLMKFLKDGVERFNLFFQGKKPPFIVRAMPVSAEIAAKGYGRFREGLQEYRRLIDEYGADPALPWPSGFPDFEDMTLENVSNAINYS